MEKLIETTKKETMKRLKTDRLLLREIRPDDVDAVFNCWMQDENVSRYMYWKVSKNIEDAKDFVSFELGNLKNNTWNRWMIVLEIPYICGGGETITKGILCRIETASNQLMSSKY